jgi:putative GTP pyrophosphokinase
MDDVYEIAKRLREQPDLHILKEKDYIKKPKSNGYMSLHLLVEVPAGAEWKRVEVQLRTVAMDFWSVLDHQLVYKKEFPGADNVGKELKAYAATIAELDQNMLRLRGKIEALNI